MPDYPPLNRSIRFTSAQTFVSQLLDFECYSAQVNSNANQWLHFVGTGQFVAPGAAGAIITLPGFVTAELEWAAPPGTVQPPAALATEANIVFYSVWLPPSPGSSGNVQQTSKPYDGQAFAQVGANTKATVTLAGIPGRRWQLHTLAAGIVQSTAGTGTVPTLNIIDGAGIISSIYFGVSGALGAVDRLAVTGLAFFTSAGNGLTVEFSGAVANVAQFVSIGAYLV